MPDNKTLPATGTGTPDIKVASRTVTYSGEAADAQAVGLVTFAGADDAKTVADVPSGEGAAATALRVDLATDGTVVGIVTETAPATDTASSGLNGRLQRIAQRLTSLIALLPAALGAGGGLKVEGNVAHDAVDSGNPVKIGGKVTSSAPATVATGDRVDAWFTPHGALEIAGFNQDGDAAGAGMNVLNEAGTGHGSWNGHPSLHNGSSWDRQRSNVDATILASAARTAATDSADQTNYNGRGLHLVIDVTTYTAGSLTITVQGKDALSGKYYTILVSAALAAAATTALRVYPGLTAAGNLTANDILPRSWRVSVAVGDATSITYSIGASVVL